MDPIQPLADCHWHHDHSEQQDHTVNQHPTHQCNQQGLRSQNKDQWINPWLCQHQRSHRLHLAVSRTMQTWQPNYQSAQQNSKHQQTYRHCWQHTMTTQQRSAASIGTAAPTFPAHTSNASKHTQHTYPAPAERLRWKASMNQKGQTGILAMMKTFHSQMTDNFHDKRWSSSTVSCRGAKSWKCQLQPKINLSSPPPRSTTAGWNGPASSRSVSTRPRRSMLLHRCASASWKAVVPIKTKAKAPDPYKPRQEWSSSDARTQASDSSHVTHQDRPGWVSTWSFLLLPLVPTCSSTWMARSGTYVWVMLPKLFFKDRKTLLREMDLCIWNHQKTLFNMKPEHSLPCSMRSPATAMGLPMHRGCGSTRSKPSCSEPTSSSTASITSARMMAPWMPCWSCMWTTSCAPTQNLSLCNSLKICLGGAALQRLMKSPRWIPRQRDHNDQWQRQDELQGHSEKVSWQLDWRKAEDRPTPARPFAHCRWMEGDEKRLRMPSMDWRPNQTWCGLNGFFVTSRKRDWHQRP